MLDFECLGFIFKKKELRQANILDMTRWTLKQEKLTFDPEVVSTAAEVTALEDSVTMRGDLWLAADLDIWDCILQLRR